MVKVSNIYNNFCRGVLGRTDMFVSSILWGKLLSPPKKVPWRVSQLFSQGKSCVKCRHFSPLPPRIFGTTTCAVHSKPLEVRSHAQARKSMAKRPGDQLYHSKSLRIGARSWFPEVLHYYVARHCIKFREACH